MQKFGNGKKITQVTDKSKKKSKTEKTDMILTWPATGSLLLSKAKTFTKKLVSNMELFLEKTAATVFHLKIELIGKTQCLTPCQRSENTTGGVNFKI